MITNIFQSSLGKKLIMALTGLFLITFLIVHLSVNLTLFMGEESFNKAAHFMATNGLIQAMQFVLAAGFIFHIVYGIIISWKNSRTRAVKYVKNKPGKSSSWASRNMIWTGIIVLLFLILHIRQFFIPIKAGDVGEGGKWASDYDLVTTLFDNPTYTAIYVVSFILLAIHLYHGFQSSIQTLGAKNKRSARALKTFSTIFCLLIGIGFSSIAIWFYLN